MLQPCWSTTTPPSGVDWMPFAGLKQSGYGTGGIPYTYRDMQIEKMTVIRSGAIG